MGIEDSFILPLIVIAICKADFSIYVLWRPKYQSPGTRKDQSSRSLFTSCLGATFLSRTNLATQACRLFFGRCGTLSVIHTMCV